MLTADYTRSRRYRAGSRRNKRIKNVGTFASDCRVQDHRIHQLYHSKPAPVYVVTTPPATLFQRLLNRRGIHAMVEGD